MQFKNKKVRLNVKNIFKKMLFSVILTIIMIPVTYFISKAMRYSGLTFIIGITVYFTGFILIFPLLYINPKTGLIFAFCFPVIGLISLFYCCWILATVFAVVFFITCFNLVYGLSPV
jgi:hypothetical protein